MQRCGREVRCGPNLKFLLLPDGVSKRLGRVETFLTPRRAPGLGWGGERDGTDLSSFLRFLFQDIARSHPMSSLFLFFSRIGLSTKITKIKDGGWTKRAEWKGLFEHSWDVFIPTGASGQSAKDNKIISALSCG